MVTNKEAKIDIAVALIFFNRTDCLQETFSAIARQRPSQLYLIQDGPRSNRPDDIANIAECRKIVENIDWECKVTKLYSDDNLGCGRRIYTGISRAFEDVDKLVIIEDDIVIGDDFLYFCKEMLVRYENDERIGFISGMNHLGQYKKCPYSYFFSSQGGAIWGWATWKRVWKDIEWNLECVEDEYSMKVIEESFRPRTLANERIKGAIGMRHSVLRGEKQTSWTTQFGFSACSMQSRLRIVPAVNLTSNNGIIGESVHSISGINRIPRGARCLYNAPTYSLPRPLVHPKYVVNDFQFSYKQQKILGHGLFRRPFRKFEALLYRYLPFLGK